MRCRVSSWAYAAAIVGMEDIDLSSPTTATGNVHESNDFIAGNLATTFLTTPKRPMPNSAKKRGQMPHLSRLTPTPGHGEKMSMIFRNAATSLQSSGSPTDQPSSNIKRLRRPLSQARSIKFGGTCQDDTMASSGLGISPNTGQYLGESCGSEWASLQGTHHRASAVEPLYPTPSPLATVSRATIGGTTFQCLGATTGVSGMCLDNTLKISGDSSPSQIEVVGKEPISNGCITPNAPSPSSVENPNEMRYPILESWRSLLPSLDASNSGSDSDGLHSRHSVPLMLPFPHSVAEEAPCSHIDTWLNGIMEATTFGLSNSPKHCYCTEDLPLHDAPFSPSVAPNTSSPIRARVSPSKLEQNLQSPPGVSKHKENIGLPKSSSSPTRPLAHYPQARTLSHLRPTPPMAPQTKVLHFAHPWTPPDHLNQPPKHQRARVDKIVSSRAGTEMRTARKDFTVREDRLAEALAQLSPDVERHRKGRRPKRERCISYWDEDILQSGSQCTSVDVGK